MNQHENTNLNRCTNFKDTWNRNEAHGMRSGNEVSAWYSLSCWACFQRSQKRVKDWRFPDNLRGNNEQSLWSFHELGDKLQDHM
jgi:hypothetical protein